MQLKENHDNKLDNEDMEQYFFPKDMHEFKIQLKTFVSILSVLFGPSSIIILLPFSPGSPTSENFGTPTKLITAPNGC